MKKFISILGMMVLFATISFSQISISLGTVTMQPSDVGNIVNVPVIATQGASSIGSMQFKISYDGTVLSPVSQSAVNNGLVNPHVATIPGGAWFAGVQGNAISPNWLDATFAGITIANGDTLFELQFTYLGGSSNLTFDAANSYVYNVAFAPFTLSLTDGAVNEQAPAQDLTLTIADLSLSTANIGDTVDIPVQIVYGANAVGSIQLEIAYDNNSLSLVEQSATNSGIVNELAATLANSGTWVAGAPSGSPIVCTWFDPTFAGIQLQDNTVLFELRFVYNGGSSAISFNAANSYVFDASYATVPIVLNNGTLTGSGVPAAPMAYTQAATSLMSDAADLNGIAVANNSLTSVYFESGTDATYGDTIWAAQSPVADSVAVSASINGLQAATEYHFRVVCENNIGMAQGTDMVFTTAAAPAVMSIMVENYDATTDGSGSTINVPVIAQQGYMGISSMQFSFTFDSLVLAPSVISATNIGVANPLAATLANAGSWLSGVSNQTINCNWFDPTFAGININSGDTLFTLQFSYLGGSSDVQFGTTNFVYDNNFASLPVDYTDGSVTSSVIYVADLVITEIMYNPPESGTDSLEFIEIYNNGDAVDLTGFSFTQGVVATFPSITLNAGTYLLYAVDSVAFENTFGISAYQWTSGGLSNGGEDIEITDANGTVIDYVDYDDGGSWSYLADGNGPSLTLCDPSTDNNDAANWSASTEGIGTVVNGNEIMATPGASCYVGPSYDITVSITDLNLSASDIGTTINVPVVMDMGYNGIGSMQFEISFDANVLSPVTQNATNIGLVNPASETTANAGSWLSGNGTGSSIVCNWFDPTFVGINLSSGTTIFELQFVYNGGTSDVTFNAGNTYIYDATFNSLMLELFDGSVSGALAPSAPMAYTSAATAIMYNEAMLNGIAVANNANTDVYFEYGTDATYGDTIWASQSPVNDSVAVSAMVQGLMANTTYHFRAVAQNNMGVSQGQDMMFTTSAPPAEMEITIADFNAASGAGSVINVPVVATMGYAGVSSMQFSITFDSTVVTPSTISATNIGIANPLAATLANAGSWLSGVSNETVNCNWFDPTFAGININTGDTLFELQFTYLGGSSDLNFGTANYVYNSSFTEVNVNLVDGSVDYQYVIPAQELFFSEYVEGSSNNKGIEIYNPTSASINLDDYAIIQAVNGYGWQYVHNFPAGASIAAGDVWVIVTDQISSSLFDTTQADEVLGYPSVVHFNGDDARGLIKFVGNDTVFVDIIGDPNNDPGAGWDVAGVSAATANHTLTRKPTIEQGNTDWIASAGTDAANSEWIVSSQNTIGFGSFNSADMELDIADVTYTAFQIGDTVNIPVVVTAGTSGIASMQFEISFDNNVLTPVYQSGTNTGLVNAAMETTANAGEWFAGAGAGNAISCNWYDPTFAGITLTTGTTLFELQFVYQGGSCAIDFVANNNYVYDATYAAIDANMVNGSVTGETIAAPMAYTEAATSITDVEAMLNGTAVANNLQTVVYFEYGTDATYGDTIFATQSPVNDSIAVSATVSGLMASTMYHYRIVAENNLGMSQGQDMTFTTAAPAAQMEIAIADFDATGMAGSTINVPVIATMGYAGISSMQFSISYDETVVTPDSISATNFGIANPLAATLANAGSWLSGVSNETINCNWFDPTFAGININSGDTLFELQLSYLGGNADLTFGTTNFVYDNNYAALAVSYIDGSVSEQVVVVADLVITEIMYNPPSSGVDSLEFVEIYNNGNAADLSGYYFSDGVGGNFPAITLAGGDYILFAVDSAAMYNTFGVDAYQWTSGALSNGGENLAISNAAGTVIDEVDFDDNSPWPTSPDGDGPSLTLCDPASDNSLAANWSASAYGTGIIENGDEIFATPGTGCTPVSTYDIAISITDMNLTASDIGTTINIPVVMDMGSNGIGSMQFDISFDANVLSPVTQSATNIGIVNPASETTANSGSWVSGNGSGSTLVCSWFDPTFAGINLASGTTLFELQFVYNGGSSDLTFNTANSYVYDASFNSLLLDLGNANISGATSPSAPMAYTEAATAVMYNEAILNGTAVANNAITTSYFEYGTDATYGDTAYVTQNPINDSTSVSAMIQGLSANTQYHFRLVAENNMGVDYGSDMTFTTAVAPAEMEITISNYIVTSGAGSTINVPVIATMGYAGVSSMQFSISYDSTIVTPSVISATNMGIANPLAATLANAGSWLSGINNATINCNWFDPAFTGININTGDTLFELQFTYLGGSSALNFAATNYVYNALFAEVNVAFVNGSVQEGYVMPVQELFISEYIEGSSNNKGMEIYNPTASTVNLDEYLLLSTVNGSDWIYSHSFPAGATLAAGDVWVMVSNQISSSLYDTAQADEVLAYPDLVYYNGDDARALAKIVGNDTIVIDLVGEAGYDPGAGWDVAGVANATKDHTLTRKPDVEHGNIDWTLSAGTDAASSEWIVSAQNTIGLGDFNTADFELDIADVTYATTQIGDTVNIPVMVTAGYNGVASMQFEINFDNMVLAPVYQTATNTGIANASASTSANGGEWFAGVTAGSINCNWFDPTFAGIDLATGTNLFELQFVYLGGSSAIDFNANNSYAYDAIYNAIEGSYMNGSVSGNVASVPLATTEGTSNVSDISATLTGTISPNNAFTIGYFEYGLTNSYGDTVYVAQNPVVSAMGVTADITGLLPATEYHYRLVATNNYGVSFGVDSVFTTANPPADMIMQIATFDASTYSIGDTINVSVMVVDGYNGVSSMQFAVEFDTTVVTPVMQSVTNYGIVNPASVTTANSGSWISGVSGNTISCNWFDPTFIGVDIQSGINLFEMQFVYNGGQCDLEFNTSSSFVYDAAFNGLGVDYIDGEILGANAQTIALPLGWSIWSTYMDATSPNLVDLFSTIVTEVIIVKDGDGMVYWPYFNLNAIDTITIGEGYQIKMLSAQNLEIYGVPVVPELTTISVPSGWSILGYLRINPGNVVSMLSSIASDVELVKNGDGLVYWPTFGLNMIGNMNPGEGYQIKLINAVTLSYPANSVSTESNFKIGLNTQYYDKAINTGNNMTVCFPVSEWQNVPSMGSEIAVKNAEGAIVGASVFEGSNTVITIWGDDELSASTDGMVLNESLSFYVWDPINKVETTVQVENWLEGNGYYGINGISVAGKLRMIDNVISMSYSVYPNPFVSTFVIDFTLVKEDDVQIALFDETGRKVRMIADNAFSKGNHSIEMNGSELPAGTYQLIIFAGNEKKSISLVRLQ